MFAWHVIVNNNNNNNNENNNNNNIDKTIFEKSIIYFPLEITTNSYNSFTVYFICLCMWGEGNKRIFMFNNALEEQIKSEGAIKKKICCHSMTFKTV